MERNKICLIDRYFRGNDTFLAKSLRLLDPQKGEDYLNSWSRRVLDLAVTVPAAIVSTPLIAVLGVAKKLEDGGSMFYIQERVKRGISEGTTKVVKIRCMQENSDKKEGNIGISFGLAPEDDPRNTKLGSFMRRFQLEELPQLFQVAKGDLSLIGIRSAPSYSFGYLNNSWGKKRFDNFLQFYQQCGNSLVDVATVLGTNFIKGEEDNRYQAYAFYVNNASLGLDLYLLWRTFLKLTKLSSGI
jgi:lipopolysaccharide/colanic/teichoic acid biosynthesis glycosyltransferase